MKFESTGSLRTYILNRPGKLNALDENMIALLRPKIEVFEYVHHASRVLNVFNFA